MPFLLKNMEIFQKLIRLPIFYEKWNSIYPEQDEECHTYLKAYNTLYVDSDDFGSSSRYEYYAMFEAVDQIQPIVADEPLQIFKKYRAARAAGISFYDMKEDDD